MMNMELLSHLKVIEIAQGVSAPMATCRLADLGAQVIKIEIGDGDWTRQCPPIMAIGGSSTFYALNRGKKGVHFDSPSVSVLADIKQLVQTADVLVTDQSSDKLSLMGLEGVDDDVCPWNDKLVVAQLSDFGKKGPIAKRKGSEVIAQAMAGYTRYLGKIGEPSIRLGADVAGCSTAIFTVQAVLAALFERESSHQGQRVDLSLLNSLLSMKTVHLAAQSDPDTFEGPRVGGAFYPPERGWQTKDKPITFAFGGAVGEQGREGWVEFVKEIGLDHLLSDARFDKTGRLTTGLGPLASELKSEYEVAFKKYPSAYIVEKVREHGGFASVYLNHEELMSEHQVSEQNILVDVQTPEFKTQVLDFPAKFSSLKPIIKKSALQQIEKNHSTLKTKGQD